MSDNRDSKWDLLVDQFDVLPPSQWSLNLLTVVTSAIAIEIGLQPNLGAPVRLRVVRGER